MLGSYPVRVGYLKLVSINSKIGLAIIGFWRSNFEFNFRRFVWLPL